MEININININTNHLRRNNHKLSWTCFQSGSGMEITFNIMCNRTSMTLINGWILNTACKVMQITTELSCRRILLFMLCASLCIWCIIYIPTYLIYKKCLISQLYQVLVLVGYFKFCVCSIEKLFSDSLGG
jgi:hypothetical protein